MSKIVFTKMVAAGNDFVIAQAKGNIRLAGNLSALAKNVCDRKFGAGADGLLWLEPSRKADIKMRIFNADGSEAEMCGNGARCAALFSFRRRRTSLQLAQLRIETKAGIIESEVKGENVKIRLTDPKDLKQDIVLKVNNRGLKVDFINTGVPHTAVFVSGLEDMEIVPLGRALRYHKQFAPAGTNVNFVEVLGADSIKVRTYERGVEDETLACGTGSTASALLFALKAGIRNKVFVHTQSKEVLKIYFKRQGKILTDVWLEGKAKKVYEGEYYV